MPPKQKEKKKKPTAEDRTEGQQYDMEYRIRTEIDNAFYEVHVQLEKWIKRNGNKNDKGIQAAFRGLEVYTRGYIEAQKESLIGTEREGMGNRMFELKERKIREAAAGLGIPEEEPDHDLRAQLQESEQRADKRLETLNKVFTMVEKERESYKARLQEKEKLQGELERKIYQQGDLLDGVSTSGRKRGNITRLSYRRRKICKDISEAKSRS